MNKILSYINKKNNFSRKQKCKKLSDKQGVVLAETMLLIAISLVIVITIFYPIFRNMVNDTLASIANWYTSALATLNI